MSLSTDWSAGILTCNAAKRRNAPATIEFDLSALVRVEATLIQARMPALQLQSFVYHIGMTVEEFREIALSFPETEEGSHMAHPDFRVGGKIFATLNEDQSQGMAKLTPEQQQNFLRMEPRSFTPASGAWGIRGATMITLAVANEDAVREALRAAWRNTAPKKLLQG